MRDRVLATIRGLHPGYFAFVMATGIISTGMFLLGPSWLSRALLIVTACGLVVLGVALIIRLVRFRSAVIADVATPERAFGFFTIVAGLNVLGVSVSIAATILVPAWPSQSALLAPVAGGMWSVGLLLYLMIVALILLRWLTFPMTPETLGPPYWILMGATAISVLAGAKYLGLPAQTPVVKATAGFVEGFTFALWAFGTWWIPLLVILGLWRHLRRHWPLTYEPTLWSVVFPLGMYSVATLTFGKTAHLAFMAPLARVMLWIAIAAWALVAIAFLVRLGRRTST